MNNVNNENSRTNVKILFLGTLMPESEVYQNLAYSPSAQNFQMGFIESLEPHCEQLTILSCFPNIAFPSGKNVFIKSRKYRFLGTSSIVKLPSINIIVIRELLLGLFAIGYIGLWSIRYWNQPRILVQYGVYSPPMFVLILSKYLFRAKCFFMLYDLGKPPKSLHLGAFRMTIYAIIDFFSKCFLRFCDGGIVINKDVSLDYGIQKKSLIVEGGVGEEFLNLSFDKKNDDNKKVIFLLSGTLWPINGTRLVLDAMKVNQNSNIEIMFAGHGMDVDLILSQGSIDPRIKYLGYLTKSEMVRLYSRIDVLVNIRLIDPDENRYLFPSKLLEFMATGKLVITNDFYGLGRDYKENCVMFEGNEPIKLSNLLDEVSSWPVCLLEERGQKTKDFVKKNKTWNIQVLKILRFMLENKSIN